jgi:hypothetical protein
MIERGGWYAALLFIGTGRNDNAQTFDMDGSA